MSLAVGSVGRLLAAALLVGCSAAAPASEPPDLGTVVGSLSEQGVEVTVGWTADPGTHPVLAVRFTPQQRGFHLYSVDLPPAGISGVGRPTRLEVGGGLAAVGVGLPDAKTIPLRVDGLDAPVPVYPDGPVTVRQPVRVTPGVPDLVWVTYAACSRSTCLPPVTRRQVALALPGAP